MRLEFKQKSDRSGESEQRPKEDQEDDANDLSSGALEHFGKAVSHFASLSRGSRQQVRYHADAVVDSVP
jgi:hypothetical protein